MGHAVNIISFVSIDPFLGCFSEKKGPFNHETPYIYIHTYIHIHIHRVTNIYINVATDGGNGRNEMWTLKKWDEIAIAVQSLLWVRLELMASDSSVGYSIWMELSVMGSNPTQANFL